MIADAYIPKLPFYSVSRDFLGAIGWGIKDGKYKELNKTVLDFSDRARSPFMLHISGLKDY